MKPHLDISHKGTLGAEDRIRMSFDEDSITHLMSILTDLYSDPELAVIREYSTNGADSHVRAGVNKPIEVNLPTELNPLFSVRDYGVGLSAAEVYENFSKYGWSSKRDTNTEAGMLGLGCKAALTYTSQFTLVAIKDAIKNVVLVTREADGTGAVQIVHTDETDEPDGVEVRVPVNHTWKFVKRAKFFYRFWDRGTVLVDGIEPTPWRETQGTLLLDDDVYVVDADGSFEESFEYDYVVMGGVPYPVTNPEKHFNLSGRHWRRKVVVHVEIGMVDFTPSREALQYTKRTLAVLQEAREFVAKTMMRKAQAYVEEATTPYEAVQRARVYRNVVPSSYSSHYGRTGFKWRGLPVVDQHYPKQPIMEWRPYSYEDTREQASTLKGGISAETASTALHVVGHPGAHMTAAAKLKVLNYMKENDIPPKRVLFYRNPEEFSPWWDEFQRVEWSLLVTSRMKSAAAKVPPYRVLSHEGVSVPTKELDRQKVTVWMAAAEHKTERRNWYSYLRAAIGHDVQILVVPKAQFSEYENSGGKHIDSFVQEQFDAWADTLSDYEKFSLGEFHNHYAMRPFETLSKRPDQILDPVLQGFVQKLHAARSDLSVRYSKWKEVHKEFRYFLGTFRTETAANASVVEQKILLQKYPLLEAASSNHRERLLKYVNDTYLASFLR